MNYDPRNQQRSTPEQPGSPLANRGEEFLRRYAEGYRQEQPNNYPETPAQQDVYDTYDERQYPYAEAPAPSVASTPPPGSVLFAWQTREFERRQFDQKFFLIAGLILFVIVGWALYTNSPIMAITFILIGITGYISLHKEPEHLHCAVTQDGIIVNSEMYAFDNIASFWIFEEPGHSVLSLETNAIISPRVHIPIFDEDISDLRQVLAQFIVEEEHKLTVVDIIERMLHI